jgi:Zn-dependent protease with chaperone function
MTIKGNWHSKGSATRISAMLSSTDLGRYSIELEDSTVYRGALSDLHVSERLGNVERKVVLENGSIFVSYDNNALDTMFKNEQKVNAFVHYLETHMGWIMVALIVTLFTAFSFFKWGIPWTSQKIAHALPHQTNQLIASSTMEFLDDYMFEKSKLSLIKQEKIREHFKVKLSPLSVEDDTEVEYILHFRSWKMGEHEIPNALALPSGDIILTDKFIELSSTQDEIDSVILHEMGHVIHRHSLEMLIEGTFVTVAVMMISGGDVGTLGDMGIGLGSLLVSSTYARKHESEADLYAFNKMLSAKIDPASFSAIMNKMTDYMNKENNSSKDTNKTVKSESSVLDYFSSHPTTKERVELANHYSQCFKEGLAICK